MILRFIRFAGCESENLYVASNGKDSQNSCIDQKNPCKTIGHAVTQAKDNDTIHIENTGSVFTVGQLNLNFTLKFNGIGTPNIKCTDEILCHFNISSPKLEENETLYTTVEFKSIKTENCNVCVQDAQFKVRKSSLYDGAFNFAILSDNVVGHFAESQIRKANISFNAKCKKCKESQKVEVVFNGMEFHDSNFSSYWNDSGIIPKLNIDFNNCYLNELSDSVVFSKFDELDFNMVSTIVENISNNDWGIGILMYQASANITIADSTFRHNTCSKSGVVYLKVQKSHKVSVNIYNTTFVNNSAALAGSSIHLNFTILKEKVSANIENCKFTNNTNKESAAGIYVTAGNVLVSGCEFHNNSVFTDKSYVSQTVERKGAGGAIYFLSKANMTIKNNIFVNNTANWFGGTLAGAGPLTLQNCYFENSPNLETHSIIGDMIYLSGETLMENVTMEVKKVSERSSVLWYSGTKANLKSTKESYINYTCPVGANFQNLSLVQYDDHTMSYKDLFYFCEVCPNHQYSVQNGYKRGSLTDFHNESEWSRNFTCHPCSFGGECRNGVIKAEPGQWGYVVNDGENLTVEFQTCPSGYCCEDRHSCVTYDSCAPNRVGILCGQCAENMSEILFSPECRDNDKCNDLWYLVIEILTAVIYLFAFLYQLEVLNFILKYMLWLPSSDIDDAAMNAYIKTIFYFYQTVDLLTVQENQVSAKIIGYIQPFLIYLLNFGPIAALFGVCPYKNLKPPAKLILSSMTLAYLLVIMGVIYLVIKIKEWWMRRKRIAISDYEYNSMFHRTDLSKNAQTSGEYQQSFKSRLATSCISVFLFNYITLSRLTFTMLLCVQVNDEMVLYIDGNVKCFAPWQGFFIVFAAVYIIPFFLVVIFSAKLLKARKIGLHQFFLSYCLPLPMLIYWGTVALKNRFKPKTSSETAEENYHEPLIGNINEEEILSPDKQKTEDIIEDLLFLLESSFINQDTKEERATYWEGILMLRRLILTLTALFITLPLPTVTTQTLICLAFLLWHLYVHPFCNRSANYLETSSLTVLTMVAIFHIIQAAFIASGVKPTGPNATQGYILDWVEWVLIVGFPLFLVLVIVISLLLRTGYWIFRAGQYCHRSIQTRRQYITIDHDVISSDT